MSGYKVTLEAVQSMMSMSDQLTELQEKIHQETAKLQAAYDENKDGLGAHSDDIKNLIDDVQSAEDEASKPVKKLVLKLCRASANRLKDIQEQYYNSQGRSR